MFHRSASKKSQGIEGLKISTEIDYPEVTQVIEEKPLYGMLNHEFGLGQELVMRWTAC